MSPGVLSIAAAALVMLVLALAALDHLGPSRERLASLGVVPGVERGGGLIASP